jgi:hypothetical protein
MRMARPMMGQLFNGNQLRHPQMIATNSSAFLRNVSGWQRLEWSLAK